MNNVKKITLLSLMVLLSACSTITPPKTVEIPQVQQNAQQWTSWIINGNLAVKSADQAGNASYRWKQVGPSQYDILIFGPLGTGTLRLKGQSDVVTLTNSKGQVFSAKTPEELLQQEAGWSMPVSNLYDWIRGLPAPGSAQTTYNADHTLSKLIQDGWTIDYVSYTTVNGSRLPNKIFMNSGDASVRLSINEWKG